MKRVVKTLEDLDNFANDAARQGVFTGQALTVTLTKFRRPRTLEQNSKLHALFRELAEHTGYSESEIKDYFKDTFGPTIAIRIGKYRRHDRRRGRTENTVPKGTSL